MTGQQRSFGILFGKLLLVETQWHLGCPSVYGGLCRAASPDFIGKAIGEIDAALGETNEAVTLFLAYTTDPDSPPSATYTGLVDPA